MTPRVRIARDGIGGGRIVVAALLTFAVALLAHWPLRLLLDGPTLARLGIGAADLHGPAWRAQARSAHWQGRHLGDLELRLQAAPLLLGQRRLRIRADGFALTLVQGRRHGVLGATGRWPLHLEPEVPGLQAALRATGLDALFEAGRCVRAAGTLGLELTLAGNGGDPLQLAMQGSPRCEGDALVAALAGAAGQPGPTQAAEAQLQIDSGGRWRLDTRLLADEPALAAGAGLAGFQPANGRYSRADAGSLFEPGTAAARQR